MSFFEFQIQENSFRTDYKFLLKMAETVAKKKRNGEFVGEGKEADMLEGSV